jgi:hypothetical protein
MRGLKLEAYILGFTLTHLVHVGGDSEGEEGDDGHDRPYKHVPDGGRREVRAGKQESGCGGHALHDAFHAQQQEALHRVSASQSEKVFWGARGDGALPGRVAGRCSSKEGRSAWPGESST